MSPILHGRKDCPTGRFFEYLCPLRQFANFFPLLFLRGRRDFIAGHFYVSRSTGHSDGTLFSRPYVPCVKLLIVLQCRQLFLKGRRDFISGHFYVSRSTGHSDGTLFSRPCVPCVKLPIVFQCRQLFLKGRKDAGTLLWDILQASRSTGHSDGTLFSRPCVLF